MFLYFRNPAPDYYRNNSDSSSSGLPGPARNITEQVGKEVIIFIPKHLMKQTYLR